MHNTSHHSTGTTNVPSHHRIDSDGMQYEQRLSTGCGAPNCPSSHCASNPSVPRLASQAAAIASIQLAKRTKKINTSCLPFNPTNQPQSPFLESLLKAIPSTQPRTTVDTDAIPSKPDPVTPADPPASSVMDIGRKGIKALSRIGSEATASLGSRAKSLLDLPSLFSASMVLPAFSGAADASGAAVAVSEDLPGSACPSPSMRSSQNVGGKTVFKTASNLSLFEERDVQVLSDRLDLLTIQAVVLKKDVVADSNALGLDVMPVEENDEIPRVVLSLLKTVKTVFSSQDALGKSFLTPGFNTNSSHLGIDLPSLRESFNILLETEPKERFHDTLLSAFEILVSSIQLNSKRYQTGSPRLLRLFIILLENPFLTDPVGNSRLLTKTCTLLGTLSPKSRHLLAQWLSTYDPAHFLRIMQPFVQYLDAHFSATQRPDATLIACIQTLALFNKANGIAQPLPLVPLAHFYNNTVAGKLNFKDEYKLWKSISPPQSTDSSASTGINLTTTAPTQFSYFQHPYLLDPVSKTRILHIDAMAQMSLEYEDAVVHQAIVIHAQRFLEGGSGVVKELEEGLKRQTNPYLVLEVRREELVKDVLDQLHQKTTVLKKPLKVKFVGGGEQGMDQGGVQKEFFQILIHQLMDPTFGMFSYDPETRTSWINPASLEPERQFELVGVILGLALYNGVILGCQFAGVVYKKLVGEKVGLEDLKASFPELGKGLEMLLQWDEESGGTVEDVFCRSFEIEYEVWGRVKSFELVQGGRGVPVTSVNRKEYVELYVNHFCGESVGRQFAAFRRGFWRVCGGDTLKMCRAEELELLICGTNELDFKELEAGAGYDDGYDVNHPVIKNFWSIAHAMSHDHKKQLLNFVTASDRVPLKGLGNLVFVIQRNGPDTDRLPTALTCFGRLLLPEYETREKLENRLVTAIENAKGFGLI
ncbi:hypothetical protein HDU98_002920 [Podochytrium sp. JEL0797]|nr:hypothetical protein HDU98_002920 [Podochytrium sp. JEL0797]